MKRKRNMKKLLAILMTVILSMSTINLTAFAADENEPIGEPQVTSSQDNAGTVHRHSESCYTSQRTLKCGIPEGEDGHVHTDDCYESHLVLTCGQEEKTEEGTVGEPQDSGDESNSDDPDDPDPQEPAGEGNEVTNGDETPDLSTEIKAFLDGFSFEPAEDSEDPAADYEAAFIAAAEARFGEGCMEKAEYKELKDALDTALGTYDTALMMGDGEPLGIGAGTLTVDGVGKPEGDQVVVTGSATIVVTDRWNGTILHKGNGKLLIEGNGIILKESIIFRAEEKEQLIQKIKLP